MYLPELSEKPRPLGRGGCQKKYIKVWIIIKKFDRINPNQLITENLMTFLHHHEENTPVDLTKGYSVDTFCAHLRSKNHREIAQTVIHYLEMHGMDIQFSHESSPTKKPSAHLWTRLANSLEILHDNIVHGSLWDDVGSTAHEIFVGFEDTAKKFESFFIAHMILRPEAFKILDQGIYESTLVSGFIGSAQSPSQQAHAQAWCDALAGHAVSLIERITDADPLSSPKAVEIIDRFEKGLYAVPLEFRHAAVDDFHAKLTAADPRLSDGHGHLALASKRRLEALESLGEDHSEPSRAYLGTGF